MNLYLNKIFRNALDVLRRFPLPVICSLIFTLNSIFSADFFENLTNFQKNLPGVFFIFIHPVVLICSCFAFTAWKLLVESREIPTKVYYLISPFIYCLIFWLVINPSAYHVLDFLVPACFLAIFVAPYLNPTFNGIQFWTFCYRIAIRLALTIIASIFIYIAVLVIMMTLQSLLDINIATNLYIYSWVLTAGLFAPVFMLAGIPKSFTTEIGGYPKGLHAIACYIVIPASIVYAIILHSYGIKIALNGAFPKGIVSYLSVIFSAKAILIFLITYPLYANRMTIAHRYGKYFSFALIVPLILLLIAIGTRIDQYGITEARYAVVLGFIWILTSLILINTQFMKKQQPQLIVTLFVALLLVASFGPFSANNVSAYSQINRLENVLKRNGILVNGKIISAMRYLDDGSDDPSVVKPARETQIEINHLVQYIVETKKQSKINHWFLPSGILIAKERGLFGIMAHKFHEASANLILFQMGIDELNLASVDKTFVDDASEIKDKKTSDVINIDYDTGCVLVNYTSESTDYSHCHNAGKGYPIATIVDGYQYLIDIRLPKGASIDPAQDRRNEIDIENPVPLKLDIVLNDDLKSITVTSKTTGDFVVLDLSQLLQTVFEKQKSAFIINEKNPVLTAKSAKLDVKLQVKHLETNAEYDTKKVTLISLVGTLFVTQK